VTSMKFGISVANFLVSTAPQDYIELAKRAEDAGWDGFFLWDHINWREGKPNYDPWILLASIAAHTNTIKIGTAVTPLPRRRPHKVARETVTIDHISKGRLILGVGLGWPPKKEFQAFGEPTDKAVRAKMLDESLEIITGLWTGQLLHYKGDYFTVKGVQFRPTPFKKKQIPIWVAGTWPKKRPFQRAAKFQGVVPMGTRNSEEFRAMMDYVKKHRKSKSSFDWVSSSSYLSGPNRNRYVSEFKDVGANWYIESWGVQPFEKQLKRIQRGPPEI
jgi:alkanesulfonate monooxygenase SsuD/methylene tetrahydromethanopterin reductase-like flavin-dependent oxidoreductase (luciferase family)